MNRIYTAGSYSYYEGVANDVVGNVVDDVNLADCAYFPGIYINSAQCKLTNKLMYNISHAGVRLVHRSDLHGNGRTAVARIGVSQRADALTAPAPEPTPGEPSPEPAPVLAPIPATPYNYHVAPNGSDNNPGTRSAPFKTIVRASRAALPGTTVHVAPGSYPGGFQTRVNGRPNGRIYFVSTIKWGARIVPPASSRNNIAWDNRGSYVDIVGFEVDGSRHQGGSKWTYGIYNGGSYGTIRNNWVHHIATTVPCTSTGGSAIGVDGYYRGVKSDVIGNLVHDIGPTGCHFVQGIYMSTSGTIKNNVVYRVAEAAIHLWHDANNVIITNNTVTSSGTGIIVGGGDYYFSTAGSDNVHVHNNIVYDNKYGISERGTTGLNNTYRNNLVYQNTYNWTLKNGLKHYETVSLAPQFASYSRTGTPDFRLNSNSPAIGKGNATYVFPYDFAGYPRNATTGYDIGAFQHLGVRPRQVRRPQHLSNSSMPACLPYRHGQCHERPN